MYHKTSKQFRFNVKFQFYFLILFVLFSLLGHHPAKAAPAGSSLSFNGTSSHITFGAAPALGATNFTLEAMVYWTGAGVSTSSGAGGITAIPIISKGRAEAEGSNVDMNYFLGITAAGNLAADFEDTASGLNHPVTAASTILTNTWNHVAATYNSATGAWFLYVNGVQVATANAGAGIMPRSDSIQHAGIGTAMTSTGVAAGFFAGRIDEVRIWNAVRTPAQIQASMFTEITSGVNLVARWGMTEATGTTINSSVGTFPGTLTNAPTWHMGFPLGSALRFDGTNDYVTFGNSALGATNFTLETWFYWTGGGATTTTGTGGATTAIPLVTKGRGEAENSNVDMNYFLGIQNNRLAADFEEGAGQPNPALNHPIFGNTVITTNTWHHAAVTYDSTSAVWTLYLDGVQDATLDLGSNIAPRSDSIQHAGIGTAMTSSGAAAGFFSGIIDETRIWNVVRTPAEINSNLYSELTTGTGLVARWGLTEGTAATAADSVAPVQNGTLTNGPTWVPGFPFPIVAPSAPTVLNVFASSGTNINLAWTDNSNNEATFEIERGSVLAGPFSPLTSVGANITNYADGSVLPLTQYCYRVRAVNSGGPSPYSNVSCATTPVEGGEALQLGSANAYVVFPNSASLNTSTYTIETWFRRDGTGIADSSGAGGVDIEPIIAKGTAEDEFANMDINYIMGINPAGNLLCADFEEAQAGATPSLNHPVCGTTAIQNGIWYHAAATYDGTTWRLYLNGMPEASLVVSQPANTVNIAPVSLGTSIQSDGTTAQGFFNGTLEEVRIWNYARTPAQVLTTVNSQLTTAQAGLIARWGLNQNTGTVINGSAGTTVNGTITGTGYSWVTPGAPFNLDFSVPTAPSGLIANASFANQVDLTWTDNSSNEVGFEIERGSNIAGPFSYLASAGTNATSYSDGTALPLTQYCYRVRAVNAGGPSVYTNVSCDTTLAESGAALQLGGANAYAEFSNSASLNSATFTVETWFRRDGAGIGTDTGTGGIASAIPLITKGTSESEDVNADINYFLAIDSATSTVCADFEEAATGTAPSQNHPVCGTTPIINGTWYHVAATYDGTTWQLYLNGLPEASLVVGQPANAASTSPVALGTSIESNGNTTDGYFNGSLDEARIWNYARSLAEIQSSANSQIAAAQPGLIGRWSLNEDAGTTVHGSAGTAVTGSISGTGYSWINPGAPFNIVFAPPLAPSALTATSPAANQVSLNWTDNSNNETNFEIEKGSALAGPFTLLGTVGSNITTLSDTSVFPTTQYCYRVRATNLAGPSGYSNASCVTTLTENASALDFGTTNSYVTFGDANALDLTQFTLEGWFRRDGTGTPNTTGTGGIANAIPLISNGSPEAENATADINYLLCINDTTDTLCADFEEGATGAAPGLNHPITGITPITNGQWYHASVTYDGTTWRLYLNGVLENQTVVNQPVNAANISATALATMMETDGTTNGFFNGAMDEVRIWNYSRTEAEIRSTINTQITSPASGLVARWGLNEGSGTAVGGTAGTIINGTVTGAGYSWITPGAPFNVTFNAPPNTPILISPPDDSTNITTSPALSATVSDPDGGSQTVQFFGRPVGSVPGPDFTIIAIPDTQHYTDIPANAANFGAQMQWIVDNKASRNIVFVTGLGDIVENGNANLSEWQIADGAYSLLENPVTTLLTDGIPFGLAVGNHDQSPIGGGSTASTTLFNQFFGTARFTGRGYYGGNYGSDNDNNYELFSAGGMDFIIIHFEWDTTPEQAVLDWADALLTTYSTRHAIVTTHYMIDTGNPGNWGTQGQAIYNALSDHENLFLMLGGHVAGEGRRQDTAVNGNVVYTLLSDFQTLANGGDGWLRIMTFSPANGTIQVQTYSPTRNGGAGDFQTDANSQFTLPFNLANSFELIGTDTVASGGTATVTWPNLNNNTEYEWYAVASDGIASATSSTWSFTTEPPANISPIITGQVPLATNEETALGITLPDLTVVDPDNSYPTGFSLTVQNGTNYTVAGTTITPVLDFNGVLTVPVVVNDGTANSNVFNLSVTVTPVNDVPTTTGIANVTVNEDAPNTTINLWPSFADIETTDNLLTYTVTANTNPALFTSVSVAAGQNLVLDYAPNASGSSQLTVRATDAGVPSQFIETTFTVTVNPLNDTPTTSGIANVLVNEDAPDTSIDLWPSFADVENTDAQLTYSVTGNTNAALFTSVSVATGQNLVLDYAPNTSGSAQLTVRATDAGALFVETTFTVTVSAVNDTPTASGIANVVVDEDASDSTIDLWPSFADVENTDAQLTYSVTGNTNAALFTSASITGGQNLILNYAPNLNGSAQLTIRATDAGALFVETTFTVTVSAVNDPPAFTSSPVTAATEDSTYTYNVTTSDPDLGDTITITAPTLPAWLTLVDNGNGTATLSGTPNDANIGINNVTLRVNDGSTDIDQIFTIDVANTNDLPFFTSSAITSAAEDVLYTYNITASDPDLGSVLTITAPTLPAWLTFVDNGNGTASLSGTPGNVNVGIHNVTLRVSDGTANVNQIFAIDVGNTNDAPFFTSTAVTSGTEDVSYTYAITTSDPDLGSVLTITAPTLPAWLTFVDNGDGTASLSGTPSNANVGTHNVTLRVSDGILNIDQSFVISVANVNDAPALTSSAVTAATEDSAYIYNVTTSDPDLGDTITITAPTLPAWLTFVDNGNGTATLSGIPVDANVGNHNVILRVNDGTVNVDQNFVIAVANVNDAPAFTSTAVTAASEGSTYTYNVTTSDPDLGDTITITAPTLPAWLTFVDNGDGTATLNGVPTNVNVGNHNVTLRVSDGTASIDQIFVITVININTASVFTSAAVTSATEDSPYTYNITVTDADLGDALTITAPTLPAWLTLTDNGNGTASLGGTPLNANVGLNNITLRVNDGTVNVDQVFTITVSNTNDTPTAIVLSNDTVDEGLPVGSLIGTFSTTDPDSGDTFTYSFCGGADDSSFQIVGNALQTNVILDADAQTTFLICIHSQDLAGQFFEQQFTITITNVNDAPVINVQSSSKVVDESSPLFFDAANSTTITINDPDAGSGNLQVTLSVTQGTLTLAATSGLTITPPADGSGDMSMTFAGTLAAINTALNGMRYDPSAGYNGSDILQITVDDLGNTGQGGNQIASANMELNMAAMPPKIAANGINSVTDTGDGILDESEIVLVGISQFVITFDQDVNNPAGDTGIDDVTNPANYKLVNDNGNDFQTTSCAGGVSPLDVSININSVSYDNHSGNGPYIATLNINDGLPLAYGNYRLFICGTTSIADIYGLKLAGDGVNAGTDMRRSFTVVNTIGAGGTGGTSTTNGVSSALSLKGILIPVTGFTPNVTTSLAAQPEEDAYTSMNDLRIEIPSLSINTSIVGIELKNKSWNVKWLEDSIGYLEGSAYPTWSGNSVLTGHSTDANGNVTSFGYIRELALGEKVMIHSNGFVYVYQVKENRLILPTSTEVLFKHQDYSWITMVTCENYNDDNGRFTSRRIVRAVLISVIPEK